MVMLKNKHKHKHKQSGFTIVELLVVIAVIGILAALITVGYGAIRISAAGSVLKSDARNARVDLENYKTINNVYPHPQISDSLVFSDGVDVEYDSDGTTYCLTVSSTAAQTEFYTTDDESQVIEGVCPGSDHVGYDSEAGQQPPMGLWTDLSSGYSYVCGIYDEAPYCWGAAANGALGSGSAFTNRSAPYPVRISSGPLLGKTVNDIEAANGGSHTCAIAEGEVFCWGRNSYGQVGDVSTSNRNYPVAVSTSGVLAGKTVTDLAVNGVHSCVIADEEMFCWGRNQYGQLGTGSTSAQSIVPVAVDMSGVLAGKTISQMALGNNHTCVIADGEAFCWGYGAYGLLGRGSTASSASPVAVDTTGVLNGKQVTDISAGDYHTCVVADGEVFCWGMGTRINNGYTDNESSPVAINMNGNLGGASVTSVAASYDHSCLVAANDAYCWGSGGSGRLGTGVNDDELHPVPVINTGALNERTISSITAGHSHSCVLARGEVFCWGVGTSGHLGNGLNTTSFEPVQVTNP